MVISHKHRYLFIELPRTGSTAISKELIENYDGKEILYKHSNYRDFLRIASKEERKYFIFSCIRNPLDREVSYFLKCKYGYYDYKLRNNYKLNFYEKYFLVRKINFIKNKDSNFSHYLFKFYKFPYSDWSCLDHESFDFIIRFENIGNDFQQVLELIGLKPVRLLPPTNVTKEKKDFLSFYKPEIMNHAKRIFGPAMKEWNYTFPKDWGKNTYSRMTYIQYKIKQELNIIYWKYLKNIDKKYVDRMTKKQIK